MSTKTTLKGIMNDGGNLAAWTGVPVGFGTPLIMRQVFKNFATAALVKSVQSVSESGGEGITAGLSSLAKTTLTYNVLTLASPFILALPFLLFKKTRGAALGVIGGGIVGDLALTYWPALSAPAAATPSTPSAEAPTEGAVSIL